MSNTAICNSCGIEVVTVTHREYDVYPIEGEAKKTLVPEREEITVEITHRRDFNHVDGYVHEEWTGYLCEGCLQRMLRTIGTSKELKHWVD